MEGEDDEKIELSASAAAALQQFYSERDAQTQRFEALKDASEDRAKTKWSMSDFTEDWNASQFWYNDETARILADELLKNATAETRIAIVSAPSIFVQLKNTLLEAATGQAQPEIWLFEIDDRFDVFEEFVKYDFEQPFKLVSRFKGYFDRILCDPPFLSVDCQTKAAMTVRWLSRSTDSGQPRIIVCTGERMEATIHKLYRGIQTTTFEPRHSHGLGNEFRCYANYASGTAWQLP